MQSAALPLAKAGHAYARYHVGGPPPDEEVRPSTPEVDDGRNGLILVEGELPTRARLAPLAAHADAVGAGLQEWVGLHALFPDSVQTYVQRLEQISGGSQS